MKTPGVGPRNTNTACFLSYVYASFKSSHLHTQFGMSIEARKLERVHDLKEEERPKVERGY